MTKTLTNLAATGLACFLGGCAIAPKAISPAPEAVATTFVAPLVTNGSPSEAPVAAATSSATFNPKWAQHGDYMRHVIQAVQSAWDEILLSQQILPKTGTWVKVSFVLAADGAVKRIANVDNQSTQFGADACVGAITRRASYGPWTDTMKADLGMEQELVITFRYQ